MKRLYRIGFVTTIPARFNLTIVLTKKLVVDILKSLVIMLDRYTLHERRQQMIDTTLAIVAVVMFALGWWAGRAVLRGYDL